jgi:Mg2+ and Co2+ transporter CorA
MKKSIWLMIAAFMLCSPAVKGQSSFTQKDRELLIELRTRMMEIDKRFEQIDKRFEQIDKRFEQFDTRIEELRADTNKRFEELRSDNNNRFDQMMSFIYILAGIFAAMTAATISFALWDRKTMIRPFETKVKEIDKEIAANREAAQKIMGFQKDYALKNREYSDVLQRHNLS